MHLFRVGPIIQLKVLRQDPAVSETTSLLQSKDIGRIKTLCFQPSRLVVATPLSGLWGRNTDSAGFALGRDNLLAPAAALRPALSHFIHAIPQVVLAQLQHRLWRSTRGDARTRGMDSHANRADGF
jgi:hypothetical protein